MMNLTESQKAALATLVQAGGQVATVVFNPSMVVGDPEADAVAAGWIIEKLLRT